MVVEAAWGGGPFDVPDDFYADYPDATHSGWFETPDKAALDITGDIDVRVLVTPTYTPNEPIMLAAKSHVLTPAAGERSWWMAIMSDRTVVLQWSDNGTNEVNSTDDSRSTARLPVETLRLWVRATLDVDDGSSQHVITYYTSTDGDSWTQLGDALTFSGTTSIWDNSVDLHVGNDDSSLWPYRGRIHAMQLYDGIDGTLVADPDFRAQSAGASSFSDGSGNTWSRTGTTSVQIAGVAWQTIPSDRPRNLSWEWGRSNELDPFTAGTGQLQLRNNDRRYDPEHSGGTHFGDLLPRVPIRWRSHGATALVGSGNGPYAGTTDPASPTGDLDIRVHVVGNDWTPGNVFGNTLVSQWGGSGNRAWLFAVNTSGQPVLTFTQDGSTQLSRTSTAATGFTDGTAHWIRAVLDVDNGASGHDVTFYTSSDGSTWTQLGSTVTNSGTVSVFDSTADVTVGDITGGGIPFPGAYRHIEIRYDDTLEADPDWTESYPDATSVDDDTGNTWTASGGAVEDDDYADPWDQFTGYVEGGWEQEYLKPSVARANVSLVDLLGVLESHELPATAYEHSVLVSTPDAYWRLDESRGTTMNDATGNGHEGLVRGGELGADPIVWGSEGSMHCLRAATNVAQFRGEDLPKGLTFSVEAWIRGTRNLDFSRFIVCNSRDTSEPYRFVMQILSTSDGGVNGELACSWFNGTVVRGETRLDDGAAHHVAITADGPDAADLHLYVDGVEEDKTVVSGSGDTSSLTKGWLWTIGGSPGQGTSVGFAGEISDVAVYPDVLTPEEIEDHWIAGSTAYDGDWSGDRIGRVLDIVGIDPLLRDIDTGDSTVGPADYAGDSAATYLQKVVESEQGVLFVDHTDGGKLKFRGRYHRFLQDRSTTSQWTLTDDPDGEHHYADSIRPDPNGVESLVNVVNVEWQGGTETVTDTDSRAAYGPQSRTIRTEAPSAQSAKHAGAWIIARHGQPQARIRLLPLTPGAARSRWSPALRLRPSDRVTVRRHPQGEGSALVEDLTIEGVKHDMERDLSWHATFSTSKADDDDLWIWGTAEWGDTTYWG